MIARLVLGWSDITSLTNQADSTDQLEPDWLHQVDCHNQLEPVWPTRPILQTC